MSDTCFSPSSLGLLAVIGGALQAVIVTLFWLAIRAKEDAIQDARELRDRALDLNERALGAGEVQAETLKRAVPPRGRRS